MNADSLRSPWSARVYTIVVTFILAVTVATVAAQPHITIEPLMTKGSATAAVTIVEFSDFQ